LVERKSPSELGVYEILSGDPNKEKGQYEMPLNKCAKTCSWHNQATLIKNIDCPAKLVLLNGFSSQCWRKTTDW
tara:strand:- start:373 stop:594 length:222 start_codon:yes stop_codon:yes gene_type:complete